MMAEHALEGHEEAKDTLEERIGAFTYISRLYGDKHFPWRDNDLFYCAKEIVM